MPATPAKSPATDPGPAPDPTGDPASGPDSDPAPDPAPDPAIELRAVTKRFGRTVALDDVSLTVPRGQVFGLVGRNGAGKSTTLRVVSGFLAPDRGRVRVLGRDVGDGRSVRALVGYLPESAPLYRDMRVAEYLAFRARLKGVPRRAAADRVASAAARCNLAGHERRVIGHLSRGFRQRVGLADALIAGPPLVLLDEPTAGLDPVQVREFRDLVAGLPGDVTVVISSHVLAEIATLCQRIAVFARGRVAGQGTVAELAAAAGLGPEASLEDVFVALSHDEPGNQPDRPGRDEDPP